jgi:hypothetical protein
MSKRLFLSFAIFLTLSIFISCKEDDPKKGISHPLIGTWVVTGYTVSNCDDPENDYTELIECPGETCQKIQYKSNGTVIFYSMDDGVFEGEEAKFTIDGNTVLACETPGDCGDLETFTINDQILTLESTYEGTGCTTTIVAVRE